MARVPLRKDNAAVSTVTGYIMNFFIATLILGVAILSNQTLIAAYGTEVSRRTLETIGNNIALRIEQVDRVIASAAGSASDLSSIDTPLTFIPLTVANREFLLSFSNDSLSLMTTGSSPTRVHIPLNITTPMATKTLYSTSGKMRMYYDSNTGLLEFE